MRILLLSHQYPPETGWGGIGSYTVTMSAALAGRGHEVHVLSCWDGQEPVDRREGQVFVHRRRNVHVRGLWRILEAPVVRRAVQAARVPHERVGADPLWRVKTAYTCYREYHRLGLDFDVVEAPDWMAEGLLLGERHTVPLVVDLKGNLLTYTRFGGQELTWHGRISDLLERRSVAAATVVTSPSHMTTEVLRAAGWTNVGGARIIRRPVEVSRWTVSDEASASPVILQIGRLETIKAPDVLLEAAARLAPTLPDLEVVLIGSTHGWIGGEPAGAWVERRAARLGVRCRIIDHTPWTELPAWYRRARVVALPSRFDNFPNVGLEAMASGRPVVCSSRTGLAEVADDSDGSVIVVPPDDPEALAAGLEPFLRHPEMAAAAGIRARAVIERAFTPDVIAAQREQVYEEATAASPERARPAPARATT